MKTRRNPIVVGLVMTCLVALGGCKEQSSAAQQSTLTFGAYTTPREVYGESIIPAFSKAWEARGERPITFSESYLGSGAQARAIIGGFEADIAALSLEPDIERLRAAGLVKADWKDGPHRGMVTRSVVVIGVREGNPKDLHTWADLARAGVEVLTPNVRTSGGAMWNILAIYGATTRSGGSRDDAVELISKILSNVKIMDRGARDSILTFERGVGDAIITYENEILVGRAKGQTYEPVIPKGTILIENPVAVVQANAEAHGTLDAARSFVDFLHTADAQRMFTQHGLRPVLAEVEEETKTSFPAVEDLFSIDDLGGWEEAQRLVFSKGGVYDDALARSRQP